VRVSVSARAIKGAEVMEKTRKIPDRIAAAFIVFFSTKVDKMCSKYTIPQQ
jgi:hypothetical protein